MKFKSLPTLFAASQFVGAPLANAAIVANFTDGSGTASANQFAGIAGNGWTSAWGNAGANTPTTSVSSTTPINGSGNYLSVNPNGAGDGAIGRAFDGTGTNGGVDATLPVVFNFDLRIDSLAGWGANTDYISLHASTGAGNYNVSGNSSFIIRGYGASPATGKNASEWLFYSDPSTTANGFDPLNFQNSGMAITANSTYHFSITNYSASQTYDVSIFDGTNTVTATSLGWRNLNTGLQTNLTFNNRESSTADTFGYSIDNISIVPEPSAALMGGVGLLALMRRRRN